MQQPLARPEANVAQPLALQEIAHRIGPADIAQQPIIGGVVAHRQRALQQFADGGLIALFALDQRGDRLMEDGKVVACQRDRIFEFQTPGIAEIEHGHGDPQFAYALLWQALVAASVDRPAFLNAAHRHANPPIKGAHQRRDIGDKRGRRRDRARGRGGGDGAWHRDRNGRSGQARDMDVGIVTAGAQSSGQ
ncbi:hypothetical protein D9M73_92850 [compost metagenome]